VFYHAARILFLAVCMVKLVSFCHSVLSFPNPLISDSKTPITLPRQPRLRIPLPLQKMGQCVFFSKIAKISRKRGVVTGHMKDGQRMGSRNFSLSLEPLFLNTYDGKVTIRILKQNFQKNQETFGLQ
jgi:hypothetical protein